MNSNFADTLAGTTENTENTERHGKNKRTEKTMRKEKQKKEPRIDTNAHGKGQFKVIKFIKLN
ncbi:MAG: hypothetical protein GX256_03555 [Fretibacterium sp.]|nr:hypothetical protein [Fretibacterium sp.]